MKYALVHDKLQEAQPGLSGTCKYCARPTIAKCGKVKIWHWAHRGKRNCDPWWENETEWHRNWKNYFPANWQEFIQQDKNGKRHIADIKTAEGWVLEFQNSYLQLEEREERNAFYEKLIWIVNGAKHSRDKKKFFKLLDESNTLRKDPQVRKIYLHECVLLRKWSGINAPVFLDFGEEVLWCLLPASQDIYVYVVEFPRRTFLGLHNNDGDQAKNFEDCLNKLNNLVSQHEYLSHHFPLIPIRQRMQYYDGDQKKLKDCLNKLSNLCIQVLPYFETFF